MSGVFSHGSASGVWSGRSSSRASPPGPQAAGRSLFGETVVCLQTLQCRYSRFDAVATPLPQRFQR